MTDQRRRRFERLARPVLPDLLRFARRLCKGDAVAAEDLVQLALIRGLERLDQLQDDRAFRVWQSRVLYTAFLNQRTRDTTMWNTTTPMDPSDPGHDAARGPEHDASARQLGRRIASALDQLPSDQREAVWLVDGQGFKFAEAAEVLGVPPGTVASRVARARVALRIDLAAVAAEQGVGR